MAKQKPACPICKATEADSYAPFCSKRCADIDLGRWFGGNYQLPGQEMAEPEAIAKARTDEPE